MNKRIRKAKRRRLRIFTCSLNGNTLKMYPKNKNQLDEIYDWYHDDNNATLEVVLPHNLYNLKI